MIKNYHFLPRKYGRELLLDIGRIETLNNYVLDSTPHQLSFYEILFIEKGKGTFALDEHKTPIAPGTVVFRALLYQLLVVLHRFYASTYNLQGDTYIHPDFFRFRSLAANDPLQAGLRNKKTALAQ